jgi:hypothetical protein
LGQVGERAVRRGAATSTGLTATASRRAEAVATAMPGCLREITRWRAGDGALDAVVVVGVGA